MSAPERDLTAMSSDAAVEVADSFEAAFVCMPVILAGREKPTMAEAVMLCGYALLHQREMHHYQISDALADLRESLDFLAARPGADETLTDHERQLIYLALKADYMANERPERIQDMDKALARFKRIVGL